MPCYEVDTKEELPIALGTLKSAGLKITKPRENILLAVLSLREPFTAEELSQRIIHLLGKKNKMDLVTIYRSLAKFSQIGLLTTHNFGDGAVRYEIVDKDGDHHHHLICKKCFKVKAIKSCALPRQAAVLRKFGYKDISHKLEFFGICPSCAIS